MQFWVGTSGYSYKEWKGSFYPGDLPDKEMLNYYSNRLKSVEINNTFYRLPKADILEKWAEQVPDDFRFVLKASRKITHFKKLKDAEDETEYLCKTATTLGERLGVLLFQLPPYLRKDLELLTAFLGIIPEGIKATFEFRHRSWFDDDVFKALNEKQCALCIADSDKDFGNELIPTANWGYLRLRRADYSENDLNSWADEIKKQNWQDVYVFFKHEDEGAGPKMAAQFIEMMK